MNKGSSLQSNKDGRVSSPCPGKHTGGLPMQQSKPKLKLSYKTQADGRHFELITKEKNKAG